MKLESEEKNKYRRFDGQIQSETAEQERLKKNKCIPNDGFKLIVVGCILFALSLTAGVVVDTFLKKVPTGHGGVASDSPECSEIGVKILHNGGTAVDSAIATMICLAVVKPAGTGLSSGGYMLLHTPKGKDVTIDFQFSAPLSASKDMFEKDKSKAEKGGLSVAIPGFLKGLALAHKKYGKLSWSSLVEPSVKLAKNGIKLDKDTVGKIADSVSSFSGDLKKVLLPNGKIPKVGETLELKNISKLLSKIASDGVDAFYSGSNLREILEVVNADGGNITEKDFKDYAALEKGVHYILFEGYKVISTPPPSGGVVVLAAMNLLNQLNLAAGNQMKTLNFHYLAEAFKFVFAERTELGDPKFEPSVQEVVKKMLSIETAVELRKNISAKQTYPPSHYGPFSSAAKTKGTANAVVLGTNGDLVSVVSTIGGAFGSGLVTKSGVILNNGMSSFSSPGFSDRDGIPPSKANYIAPGKRPLSAASPLITFNKKKPCSDQYVVGASGGAKSITATIQVLIDLVKYHLTADQAVRRPRIHTQLFPDVLYAEGKAFKKAGINSVLTELKAMGHKVDSSAEKLASVNVISQKDKSITTFADERGGGGSVRF